jgi:6,7-dimethyl-8-ribityllumazine synthase
MQKAKMAEFKPFDAHDWKIGIVVSQFNHYITDQLYEGAVARAQQYKISGDNIHTIKVAGCVEIPLALQQLAKTKQYDALLALGCIIQGDTPHFDYVCKFVTEGVLRVQLDHNQPIGFGILTCDSEEQALARTHLGRQFLDAVTQQTQAIRELVP